MTGTLRPAVGRGDDDAHVHFAAGRRTWDKSLRLILDGDLRAAIRQATH